MPKLNRDSLLDMLTKLNLTVVFLGTFLTQKKNHCVLPLVLISFCKIKSYSLNYFW